MGFREYLSKAQHNPVQHPGSRGGHPWWDGHEWRYDHPPHEGDYSAEPEPSAPDDQEIMRSALHNSKSLGPELAGEREKIEKYGYAVREALGSASDPLPVRKRTFRSLIDALSLLHRVFPGLTNVARSTDLLLVVNSAIPHPESIYGYSQPGGKGRRPIIVIDGEGSGREGRTLWHEIAHQIDTSIARREPGQELTRKKASETTGHPVHALISVLKKTPEHKAYVREATAGWPEGRAYVASQKETFARAFDAYMRHQWLVLGQRPSSPLARRDMHEDYSPEQLEVFGQELRRILRESGIEKSLRHDQRTTYSQTAR